MNDQCWPFERYRDLKAANILLTEDGVAKIGIKWFCQSTTFELSFQTISADFGISLQLDATYATGKAKTMIGSPYWSKITKILNNWNSGSWSPNWIL